MKPRGAVDPFSDEVGTGVRCRKIVHLSFSAAATISRQLALRKFAA